MVPAREERAARAKAPSFFYGLCWRRPLRGVWIRTPCPFLEAWRPLPGCGHGSSQASRVPSHAEVPRVPDRAPHGATKRSGPGL